MIEYVVFVKTVHKIKRHQIGYYLDYMFKSNVTVIQMLYPVHFFWTGGTK